VPPDGKTNAQQLLIYGIMTIDVYNFLYLLYISVGKNVSKKPCPTYVYAKSTSTLKLFNKKYVTYSNKNKQGIMMAKFSKLEFYSQI
jgi:hypothetical protein